MEQLQGNGNNIKSVVKKVWILFFFFYPFAPTLSDLTCVCCEFIRENVLLFSIGRLVFLHAWKD